MQWVAMWDRVFTGKILPAGLIGCVDLRLGKGPLDFYNLLIATAVMAYVPLRDWLRVRSVHFLSARDRTFKP